MDGWMDKSFSHLQVKWCTGKTTKVAWPEMKPEIWGNTPDPNLAPPPSWPVCLFISLFISLVWKSDNMRADTVFQLETSYCFIWLILNLWLDHSSKETHRCAECNKTPRPIFFFLHKKVKNLKATSCTCKKQKQIQIKTTLLHKKQHVQHCIYIASIPLEDTLNLAGHHHLTALV